MSPFERSGGILQDQRSMMIELDLDSRNAMVIETGGPFHVGFGQERLTFDADRNGMLAEDRGGCAVWRAVRIHFKMDPQGGHFFATAALFGCLACAEKA